ncbi:HET domain containing protein [Hyaloscypha variabilis]
MSPSLCLVCRKINFQKHAERKLPTVTLGSWEQICERQWCTFCCLVRDSFRLHARKPLPYSTIKLSNKQSWKCCTSYNEFDGIRWQSYSNIFDLRDYAAKTRTGSRYQFLLYWEEGKEKRTVLIRPLRTGPFFGRVVNQNSADLDLCRRWLDICDDHHVGSFGQCTLMKTSPRFLRENLRLIDVYRKHILRVSTDRIRYVALSYVWGKDQTRREIPTSTKSALRIDEWGTETIELPDSLPHTIEDAIKVTQSIGYRYLWVDSLCIIQDDHRDKATQIDMMGEIYSNAAVTIAAGSGRHADWGLPGISRPRHFAQRSATINGVQLAVEFPSYKDLNSSDGLYWNTRGWTLQEKVLSRRLLLFTDCQVYFRCANSVCAEDIPMEAGALSTNIKRRQNPFEWGAHRGLPGLLEPLLDFLSLHALKLTDKDWDLTFFPNYVALVGEFSRRAFTNKKDTLNAIAGVLSTLDNSDMAFPGGLPQVWLAEALLWQPEFNSGYSISPPSSRVGIPSWSWAAWSLSEGCVWTHYARSKGIAREGPTMTMHEMNAGTGLKDHHSYRIPGGSFGPRSKFSKLELLNSPISTTARQQIKQSGTLLSFWSQVRRFKIGGATILQDVPDDALRAFYLLDQGDYRVGKIWTCARIARMPHDHKFIALSIRETGWAVRNAVAEKYLPGKEVERAFPVHSETGDPVVGHPRIIRSQEVEKNYDRWTVTNVMLVEWEGDVAFRVAVGQVISTAWESGRRERLVYLG